MTPQERFKLILSVYLILEKDGQTLLLRRTNTGYEDGNYGLVAGHVDGNESATTALCREVFEESGLVLKPDDVYFVHLMHRIGNDERVDIFFTATKWKGEPFNKEPDKCDELSWYPLEHLPDNVIPYIRQALDYYHQKLSYSEFGWKEKI